MTSESWAGFTDEDIKRIKSNPSLSEFSEEKHCETSGVSPVRRNKEPWLVRKLSKREKALANASDCCAATECNLKDSRNARHETSQSLDNGSESLETETENSCETKIFGTDGVRVPNHDQTDVDAAINGASVNSKCAFNNNDEEQSENGTEDEEHNLPALEVFELRQKRIEAENARRRALINKAIMDKKKRTQAEAVKLAKITEELNRLDSNLSADVSILRNYIERASYEFSEAEKRYLKAEKEFVEAKLVLFDKMQRKEQLTEHLCAIIEQNENRKANKLVELMKQLEMEAVVDDCNTNSVTPILSSLCILNDEAYHSCQTLKPNSPKATTDVAVPDESVPEEEKHPNTDFPPVSSTDESCIQEGQNNISTMDPHKSISVDEKDSIEPRSECESAEHV